MFTPPIPCQSEPGRRAKAEHHGKKHLMLWESPEVDVGDLGLWLSS